MPKDENEISWFRLRQKSEMTNKLYASAASDLGQALLIPTWMMRELLQHGEHEIVVVLWSHAIVYW